MGCNPAANLVFARLRNSPVFWGEHLIDRQRSIAYGLPTNMNKHTQAISNHMKQLTEEARALISATGDVAGDRVQEARKRAAATLEHGKEIYSYVCDKAVAGTKAADGVVRENSYQAIAIGIGIGVLIGCIIARRKPCKRVCSDPGNSINLEE